MTSKGKEKVAAFQRRYLNLMLAQGQGGSTSASAQGSGASDSSALGSQAGLAKPGDVSTERKPGSLTNQQVPKNLTAADPASVKDTAGGLAHKAADVAGKAAAGTATGGAAGGAIAAVGGMDDAMPQAKLDDVKQVAAVADTLQNTTELLQNTTDTVVNATGLSSVKQQVERVLQDGERLLNKTLGDGNIHSSGKSMMGSLQSNAGQSKVLDSARMSQLFGVFGAFLVFGLWMRKRRRRPHVHAEPGLLGPGVSDQGIGGWLKPLHSRHRLAND